MMCSHSCAVTRPSWAKGVPSRGSSATPKFSAWAIVGTKAACQAVGHLVKIILFGLVGLAFSAFLPLLALLVPMVLLGTWVGTRLLERVDERVFIVLFKTVLTLVASWLVVSSILSAA